MESFLSSRLETHHFISHLSSAKRHRFLHMGHLKVILHTDAGNRTRVRRAAGKHRIKAHNRQHTLTSSQKQKAHLISHTHKEMQTRSTDVVSPPPFSLSPSFQPPNPLSGQCERLADCFLSGGSCSACLLRLHHLINCRPGGDELKRREI